MKGEKKIRLLIASLVGLIVVFLIVSIANQPAEQTILTNDESSVQSSSVMASEDSSISSSASESSQVQANAAPSEAQQNANTQNKEEIVYVTKYGKKYHQAGCQYLKGRNDVIQMTKSEAELLGYIPCEKCKP